MYSGLTTSLQDNFMRVHSQNWYPSEDGGPILKFLQGVSCPELQLLMGIYSELIVNYRWKLSFR